MVSDSSARVTTLTGTALPPPLVAFSSHPAHWIRNKIELTIDAIVLGHVGVCIVAAVYYLATQTNPSIKHWWDTTVTPATLRHDIRDVGEGVLASCFAQAIVWNPFKRSHRSTGHIFRQLRQRYRIPVGLASVVTAGVIGAAAFIAGEGVLRLLSVHPTAHRVTGSLWNRTISLWRANWQKKVLGFGAAVAARRPLHVLFDRVQGYFAGRRAAGGKSARFYHPPVFAARCNCLTALSETKPYPTFLTYVISFTTVLGAVLAGFGYYVLTYRP